MPSFAEAVEAQRADAADRLSHRFSEELGLYGQHEAEDAFRTAQLMGLLDEVVEVATLRDGYNAKWNLFMERCSVMDSEVDPGTNTLRVVYLPAERPVAVIQWNEPGRIAPVGFRLTLEQPNFDRLIVGVGEHDGVYLPLGDKHTSEVVASRYTRPEPVTIPRPY